MNRWTGLGWVGALWGWLGVLVLIGHAAWRLSVPAREALAMPLHAGQWLGLVGCVLFMGVFEGYRGFQCGFAPRVAARARYLREHPYLGAVVFAPFFCMGFFHATRRRLMASWMLTVGIVTLVLLVRLTPQPWRGIIDCGVVVGLVWGVIAIFCFGIQAFCSRNFPHDPQVPPDRQAQRQAVS